MRSCRVLVSSCPLYTQPLWQEQSSLTGLILQSRRCSRDWTAGSTSTNPYTQCTPSNQVVTNDPHQVAAGQMNLCTACMARRMTRQALRSGTKDKEPDTVNPRVWKMFREVSEAVGN
ncbi:hypothetical protein HaLaN_08325 [Haematococcus lacustris]|uniref:Uncharacterized protein n=1 Tax=Haematococcus lacustris TaxID=44745 RepID=A0A699YRY1_HAELA|nr:hypothetical protein HaLaN_08325 [Haematococcus lacustris]